MQQNGIKKLVNNVEKGGIVILLPTSTRTGYIAIMSSILYNIIHERSLTKDIGISCSCTYIVIHYNIHVIGAVHTL